MPKTYPDDKSYCQLRGGNLVSIKSDAQNRDVDAAAGGKHVWIGGTDARREGTWMWENRVTFRRSGRNYGYSNWHPGEPNDHGGNEGCVEMRGDGRWNGKHCNEKFYFI
eukprot:7391388-Prymnesium_polylepis.1